jgi:histidine triad (HIT) family protein
MDECIFCKIIKKESPAEIIFENDLILALTPLHQVSKGHTIVIPKQHFKNIFDVEDLVLRELISVTKNISNTIIRENNATGVNVLNASGKDAQQSVFHLHFHIVPRYPTDGLDMWIKQSL